MTKRRIGISRVQSPRVIKPYVILQADVFNMPQVSLAKTRKETVRRLVHVQAMKIRAYLLDPNGVHFSARNLKRPTMNPTLDLIRKYDFLMWYLIVCVKNAHQQLSFNHEVGACQSASAPVLLVDCNTASRFCFFSTCSLHCTTDHTAADVRASLRR
jgi:hypothetical protein